MRLLARFKAFAATDRVQENENFRVHTYLYLVQARINQHFLQGTFTKGLEMVPAIEEKLKEYSLLIDPHREMVLTYKIASLYFGSGNYDVCIDYLQKILNDNVGLRYDLQCYARLMHLLAHYELGNYELMEYLSKSVYRFMAKMENLTLLEEEMLKFLRRSFYIAPARMKAELTLFLQKLKEHQNKRFQARVFVYLDIISWVESKVYATSITDILQKKYAAELDRRNRKPRQAPNTPEVA